jgi:hypothetical protein
VALHTWWDSDPSQTYWMEVATTGSMGEILIAPKFSGASWSYELVSQVHPGDRVLHWESSSTWRGLTGWSVATSDPELAPEYTWQPRGTSGRALAGPRTTEGWMVTLGGLNRFHARLSAQELQRHSESVLKVADDLERTYGKPTYFPFYLYGGRELRAQQGYLVKFPIELFDVLPGLAEAGFERPQAGGPASPGDDEIREDDQPTRRSVPRGRTTRIQDPVLRAAIENHAVETAIDYYRGRGGAGFVKLGKPYDVSLRLAGRELHVEVKGSTLTIGTVELTANEVTHAEDHQPTALVVVDGIEYTRNEDGTVNTSGGRLRVWPDWAPNKDDLVARRYAYLLPPISDATP